MIEHVDPTDRDGDLDPDDVETLPDDELAPDPDGEAMVVPGQRPGPTEPIEPIT